MAELSCEKKFLIILYFVEFLAYIEITKSNVPKTFHFFKKRWCLFRRKTFEQKVLFWIGKKYSSD